VAAIVPSAELPPTVPFTSYAIVASSPRHNEAANACEAPSATFADDGEIASVAEHVTLTKALPAFVLSARFVAVTVTLAGAGCTVGAA
jgi:hypothetical protein